MVKPIDSGVTRAACRRASDESGLAMIVAMVTLLIVSVLAIGAFTLSLTTNQGARQDTAQIDASEASQAGLQVALYRYNMLAPSSGNCVGNAVAAPGSNGVCTSSWVTMGNGSKYQYSTTPVMSSSGTCVGGVVQNTVNISNICITAVGMDNNQTSRTEIRAASFAGAPLFPYTGITALQGITETNGSFVVNAAEATNGPITLSSETFVGGASYQAYLGPTATYSASNGTATPATPTETRLSSPIVLSAVNPGTSATTNANSTGVVTNDTQYFAPVTYSSTNRSLSMSPGGVITLTGGIYNFCSINLSGGILNIATGAKVTIYIDSHNDSTSGCQADPSAGTVSLSPTQLTINNPSADPTSLQIYVYPTTVTNTISLGGTGSFVGSIYAPSATVNLTAGAAGYTFTGAIAASSVTMQGTALVFNWGSQDASLQAGTQGLFYRTAFGECGQMSSTAPTAGCS